MSAFDYTQVTLVVNVASECGYTDLNYRELVKLQSDFEAQGFTVLAFPCNQFGQQEPGTDSEILRFAQDHYDINFPIFSKIDVHGSSACEVYQCLVGETAMTPSWNFCKYLVDGNGQVMQYFSEKEAFTGIRQSVKYLLSRHSEL